MPYIVKEQQKTQKYRFPQCQKICGKLLQQMGYYKISFKKKGKKMIATVKHTPHLGVQM